jgi:large repetitive protein
VVPYCSTNCFCCELDCSGYSSTCSHEVRIIDNEPPTINCPETIAIGTDPGESLATISLDTPIAVDNDSVISLTNNATSDKFEVGVNTVRWVALDPAGNYAFCDQKIHVNDNESPEITCPLSISTERDPGRNYATVDLGSPITSDNIDVVSVFNDAPDHFLVGSTTVIWTAVDEEGNIATCDQFVDYSKKK